MNFKRSESIGKIAENLVTKLFNGCGLQTTPVSFSDRKLWDIKVDIPQSWGMPTKPHFTTEVKHDVYEQRSGNLAVEVWNTKKNEPSGIKITQADLWTFVLSDSIWITRSGDLRTYIDAVPPKRIIENAGDGNAMVMLYESQEILQMIFHRLDGISKKEVVKVLKELCSKTY